MIARLQKDKNIYPISLGLLAIAAVTAVFALIFPLQYIVIPIVLAIAGLFFLNRPALFIIFLLFTRTGIDFFARQYRIFDQTVFSVNILGLLNIGLVIFAALYFFLLVHKAPNDLIISTFLLFLVAEFFSLLIAVDKVSAFRGLMMTGSFLALYMIIVFVFRSQRKLFLLRSAVILSTIFPMLLGLYQILTGTGNTLISPGLNRIMGTLFHPSALGMYLAVIWPLIIYHIASIKSKNQRVFYWFLLLVVTLMIGLTFTRIAWIGLVISIIGTTIIYRKIKLGLAFLSIFLLTGILFSSVIVARFGDAIILSGSRLSFATLGSVAWRFEQWRLALDLWAQNPVFGVGLWNFPLYDRWQSTPHNEFLRIGAELGTFGIVSYILLLTTILGWFTWMYFHKPTHSWAAKGLGTVILVIINYILFSTTDNPLGLPEVSWYVWAIIAMGVATTRLPINLSTNQNFNYRQELHRR